MADCDCTDDYGPCERHGETLAQRAGASNRTADELARVFIDDAVGLGAELSPYGAAELAAIDDAWDGDGWCDDPDVAERLHDLAHQVESYLADLVVIWNDGYVIVRPTADCPLYL